MKRATAPPETRRRACWSKMGEFRFFWWNLARGNWADVRTDAPATNGGESSFP